MPRRWGIAREQWAPDTVRLAEVVVVIIILIYVIITVVVIVTTIVIVFKCKPYIL